MFPLLIKAVKVEGLKAPEKATLIQIADLTNELKGKQAWPSEEYLAVKTGFGRKTVSRAKKSLRDRGILSWLSPKQSSAKNSSCIYTINEKELEKYLPNTAPASIGVGHSDPSDAGSQVIKSVGKSHIDTQVGLERSVIRCWCVQNATSQKGQRHCAVFVLTQDLITTKLSPVWSGVEKTCKKRPAQRPVEFRGKSNERTSRT